MKKDKEDSDLPAIHLSHKNIKQFNSTSFSNREVCLNRSPHLKYSIYFHFALPIFFPSGPEALGISISRLQKFISYSHVFTRQFIPDGKCEEDSNKVESASWGNDDELSPIV